MTQALIVALAYWALILLYRLGANGMADRPIVVGPVIGLILGDVVTGTLIGAQLEVIYLGIVNVGGAQATDTLYATTLAVALSIIGGIPQEAAITLAIPLGFIGLFMLQVTRIFFAFMCPILDKIAESGNARAYSWAYILHIVVGYGLGAVTILIALLAGAEATQTFINALPPFIMDGMKAAGGMLPALGLGVLLSMIWDKKKMIYFLLGFVIVVYMGIPMIGLAVIGVFLMLMDLYRSQDMKKMQKAFAVSKNAAGREEEEEVFLMNEREKRTSLRQILRRSWAVGAAYNNVRGQGHGCLFVLYPLLNKLYPDPKDRERKLEAVKRHLVFYNITPQVNTLGLGLFAAMEEKIAEDNTFDASTVNAIKAAVMGPASGIGDAMFQVTIRIVAASIGLGLALQGNPLGGLLFFLIFNGCSYFIRRYLLRLSYESGEKLVSEAAESGIIQMLSSAAAIIGLFMVGGMVANTVSVSFGLSWEMGGGEVTLQSFFDAIMPKLVPLLLTLGVTQCVRKKVNSNLIMLGIIVLGIVGAFAGLF